MIPIRIVQIIAGLFAIFALSRALLRFREGKLSSFAFIFWFIVWVLGMVTILFPNLTSILSAYIGIGRGADAVIYASIVVIFYLIFRVYIKIEDTQKQMTELVRRISIQKIKIKKKIKKKQ